MTVAVTQTTLDIIGPIIPPNVDVTQVTAQVLGTGGTVSTRVTQTTLDGLGKIPTPDQRFTQIYAQILFLRTPLYGFTAVILPDVFPNDISYNSVGSIRFATDVTIVDSGDDQRISRWAQPLMEFDVAYGVRTMNDLQGLQMFFRAMRGRLYAFNYRDWTDYTSSTAVAREARAAPAISALDQVIASGDGSTTVFQLTKTYASQTQSQVRPIVRVDMSVTPMVALNGVAVSNWSIDPTTGLLTFSSPYTATIVGSVTKGSPNGDNQSVVTGGAGAFSAYQAYVGNTLIISGFGSSVNNTAGTNPATIEGVAGDGSTITLTYQGGSGTATDSAGALVLQVNPAPEPSVSITAGFQFFVPCRFDTDILPTTLEDYGIGSINSVKLIEVRPTAF